MAQEKRTEEQPKDDVKLQEGESPAQKTSEEVKPTAPLEPGKIDLAGEFIVDKKGSTVLGSELISGYQRGRMFDKTQSELQKLQTEHKQVQADLETERQEKAELAAVAAKSEQAQVVAQQLEAMGIKASGKGVSERSVPEEDAWLTEPKAPEPTIDSQQVARLIQTTAKEAAQESLGDVEKTVTGLVQQELQRREAERARQEKVKQFVQQARSARADRLREELGLEDEAIDRIIKLEDAAKVKAAAAEHLVGQDDIETAGNEWDTAMAYEDTAMKMRADAKVEFDKAQRGAELNEQLISGRFPGLPQEKETERKINYNEKDRQAQRKKMVDLAAEHADLKDAAKKALGGR